MSEEKTTLKENIEGIDHSLARIAESLEGICLVLERVLEGDGDDAGVVGTAGSSHHRYKFIRVVGD